MTASFRLRDRAGAACLLRRHGKTLHQPELANPHQDIRAPNLNLEELEALRARLAHALKARDCGERWRRSKQGSVPTRLDQPYVAQRFASGGPF